MDLNLLRVFLAVYETRSVTLAAERLFITQPSVSYALKRLREELKDELFNRSNGRMQPTLLANQLYDVFKRNISDIDRTLADIKVFDSANSHHKFKLAMSDLGEFFFLPYIYRHLQKVAPNISLEVVQLDISNLEEWLMTGKVDAAICNRNSSLNGVLCEVLLQDEYVCLLNKNHPRIDQSLSMESFLAEKHIMVSSQAGHHYVEERLRQSGYDIHISLRVPHFSALGELISATECLTTLPSSIGYMYVASNQGIMLKLPFEVPKVEVCLYKQMDSGDIAAKQWFSKQLKSICSAIGSPVPRIHI
ncbi:LysR family transcriptional regulator [Pantoea endophytica]